MTTLPKIDWSKLDRIALNLQKSKNNLKAVEDHVVRHSMVLGAVESTVENPLKRLLVCRWL